jgi:hypothetical protein
VSPEQVEGAIWLVAAWDRWAGSYELESVTCHIGDDQCLEIAAYDACQPAPFDRREMSPDQVDLVDRRSRRHQFDRHPGDEFRRDAIKGKLTQGRTTSRDENDARSGGLCRHVEKTAPSLDASGPDNRVIADQ